VAEATHHAAHRSAFGKLLIDQPLMQNVLADLCLESEAATLLAVRLARAFDPGKEPEFQRLATPIAKYWICKRATPHAVEALEVLGGNGFVEDSSMPRLLRDSPLNSIWEGSGNVIALDVLRVMAKEPRSFEVLLEEAELARGSDVRLDEAISNARREIGALAADPDAAPYVARRVVERLALVLQASLVVRHSPTVVAEAFVATRIAGDHGMAFGTLPAGLDVAAIIDRHRPRLDRATAS
jgi:putative acyl-CoA dehydrogenase